MYKIKQNELFHLCSSSFSDPCSLLGLTTSFFAPDFSLLLSDCYYVSFLYGPSSLVFLALCFRLAVNSMVAPYISISHLAPVWVFTTLILKISFDQPKFGCMSWHSLSKFHYVEAVWECHNFKTFEEGYLF